MAVRHVQIRSANAAAADAQNELALARHRVVERLDDQGLPRTLEHRGLHRERPRAWALLSERIGPHIIVELRPDALRSDTEGLRRIAMTAFLRGRLFL